MITHYELEFNIPMCSMKRMKPLERKKERRIVTKGRFYLKSLKIFAVYSLYFSLVDSMQKKGLHFLVYAYTKLSQTHKNFAICFGPNK